MTLRDGIRDSIHNSILSILDAQDASHPNYPTSYYLDPVDFRVVWFTRMGSWVPTQIHDGIWVKVLDAPIRAIPQSIVDNLLKVEDVLVEDCLRFQEDGYWQEKPDYFPYALQPACFWDPSVWFDLFDIVEIREKWEGGMSPEEIVGEVCLGDILNGKVDYHETLEWVNGLIQQW